ncbi:3'-5' exonuclease [Neisseria sp. N95_16]|uniref:Exonuclease domain-containing protein n=1 Tax=Neisseria brasiliensis TaxID=2666100 RepID=A0A7X2GZ06_9NEIS|nr:MULTISPECIES: 3'-5' exonuclease [Neisseria]MRN38570.1 hypothetical protein [Neisseria brasiliensis]PJO10487.1 3'-5' exonuclease [Neisseria sp. N95_16]
MNIIGIDTETTGVTDNDDILQIAAIKIDPDTWDITERFVSLVKPRAPITPAAELIHGISYEMVKNAPRIEDVLNSSRLKVLIDEADIVFGHNISFDLRFIGPELFHDKKVLDTLRLTRVAWPLLKSHRLQSLVQHLGLPSRPAHDALGDIESCVDVLKLFKNSGSSIEDLLSGQEFLKHRTLLAVRKLAAQRNTL